MTSWQTTDFREDPLKPSLIERAKKRKVEAKRDPGWFLVHGDARLGDSYDSYDVRHRPDGSWWCSCQGNKGGQYRKVCSHKTAAALYEQEHGDKLEVKWGKARAEEEEWETEEDGDKKATYEDLEDVTDWERDVAQWATDNDPEDEADDEDDDEDDDEADADTDTKEESSTDFVGVEVGEVSHTPGSALDPYEYLDPDTPPEPNALVGENHEEPPFPEKFTQFRADQWRAITEVTDLLDEGYKVVMVSAPTGAGKTVIAESVRRMQSTPAVYMCTTKTLQDQIIRDFSDYARVLKGRSNYRTLNGGDEVTCDDCTKERATIPACVNCPGFISSQGLAWGADEDSGGDIEALHCTWCHPVNKCPYTVAKAQAVHSRLAVLNTSYFLTETNYARGEFAGWDLALIDEADKLEEELMRFVEVSIGPYQRKDLGIGLPAKKTVDEAWVEWINEEVIPAIEKKLKGVLVQKSLDGIPDVKAMKRRKRYQQMLQEVKSLIEIVEDPETGEEKPVLQQGWVYTGYEGKEDQYVTVTFKPVMVKDFARAVLWEKASQFVLLSATLISAEQMAYDLGLEEGEWAVVDVPSSFPVERRPIVVDARTPVTRKTKDEAYPLLVAQIDEILEEHPDERVLIHSVSYDLTKEFYYKLSDQGRLYTYFSSKEREGALERYLADERGVMIAPSFDRGVDLHGDDCRVIVVAKVPFPYLGDAQVKKRTYGTGRMGRVWYAVQTIRTICQMTGRGMRSPDDWCKTYILDQEFQRLYAENRRLFPSWWSDALVWDPNDPRWKDVLEELGRWE